VKDREALKSMADLSRKMAAILQASEEETARNQALLRSLIDAQETSRAEAAAALRRAVA
jgi:hypothetical protein